MSNFQESLEVLESLFAKDCQFALATISDQTPSVRIVDTFYNEGSFYIVTYANSKKVVELMQYPNVALCHDFYNFTGTAENTGHPLKEDNLAIREKLTKVFAPWYFAHNNENDENMCYVKVNLTNGFYYKDGKGYKVDFMKQTAEVFPFSFDNDAEIV
ncbi:pyridoxamine 5'-phosphate oxidase family protein [Fusibacter bizertensis]